MVNLLKSHTLIAILGLCLIGFISFWALEKDKCFEIRIKKGFQIKTNCQ